MKLLLIIHLSSLLLVDKAFGKFDPIAFDVQLTRTFTTDNPITIPYNVTLTNHKFARIENGVFTCTKAGSYKFQAYASTTAGNRFFLDLMVNHAVVSSVYGHARNDMTSGGNAIVVALKVGDTVHVQARGTYASSLVVPPNWSGHMSSLLGTEMGSMFLDSTATPMVAFSVTSERNQILTGGEIVQYNTQLVEDNGTFDMTTGIFQAPASGYFIFHFFGFSQSNKAISLDLMVNTDYICSLYAMAQYNHAGAGNTAIVHVNNGDNVTIVGQPNSENHIFGTETQAFTTFTGALLISDIDLNKPAAEPVVLFSTGLTNTTQFSSDIIFDKIFCNVGGAYDNDTGIFTARVSGVYEFNVHANFILGGSEWNIFHNNIQVAGLSSSVSTANAVILKLIGGDKVNVRTRGVSIQRSNLPYSTFSGHLLHANGPDTAFVG